MKKSGKKKFVPAIIVSSIGLLLGGLIFLGISAFPELLEEEKEVQEEEKHLVVLKTDIVINADNGYVSQPGEVTNSAEAVASYDNMEVITISSVRVSNGKKDSLETKSHSHDDLFMNNPHQIIEDASSSSAHVNEQQFENEHVSFASSKESTRPLETVKVKKAKVNKNKSMRSNEALVETSLLVIGAVDIISMILIKRKKHLLR